MAGGDEEFHAYVEEHMDGYVERLAEFVAIPSVSAEPARRPQIREAVLWMKERLDKVGGETRLEELGEQTLPDGTVLPLPPVLLAQFGDDPMKKTLVAYGHLDVMPAAKEDGWNTEPFVLTEIDGALYGRGSTDDKGPVLAWLAVIEAHQALGRELPVNMRFIFEGMEESGSVGLAELLHRLGVPGGYLDPEVVDYVTISDNYWTGTTKPCLTHGLRGMLSFHLEVAGSSKDLHSGVNGGAVHEAMTVLVNLMAGLVDCNGRILIEGFMDEVPPMTEEERELMSQVEFDLETFKQDTGVDMMGDDARCLHDTKEGILAHRWRYPTLSLHGIQGAFAGPGTKTVIPGKVIGKFSIRTVPNMTAEHVEAVVRKHVEAHFARLGSACQMKLTKAASGNWWYRSPNDPNFQAAAAATNRVYGEDPVFNREGGSIPITELFEAVCDASCVLIPIGACNDSAHSQNEKFDRRNFSNGIKVLGHYLDELAKLAPPVPEPPQAAAATRAKAERRRRRCKIDLTRYGCDCLECQIPDAEVDGAAA